MQCQFLCFGDSAVQIPGYTSKLPTATRKAILSSLPSKSTLPDRMSVDWRHCGTVSYCYLTGAAFIFQAGDVNPQTTFYYDIISNWATWFDKFKIWLPVTTFNPLRSCFKEIWFLGEWCQNPVSFTGRVSLQHSYYPEPQDPSLLSLLSRDLNADMHNPFSKTTSINKWNTVTKLNYIK